MPWHSLPSSSSPSHLVRRVSLNWRQVRNVYTAVYGSILALVLLFLLLAQVLGRLDYTPEPSPGTCPWGSYYKTGVGCTKIGE